MVSDLRLLSSNNVLLHLSELYATRNISVWRSTGALPWLAQACLSVVKQWDKLTSAEFNEVCENRSWQGRICTSGQISMTFHTVCYVDLIYILFIIGIFVSVRC